MCKPPMEQSSKAESKSLALELPDTGLEVFDIQQHQAFAARHPRTHDLEAQMEGMRRIAHTFIEQPTTVLQELVNLAIDLCGADSAGISIEKENGTDAAFYHWIATAGQYSGFLNATLPRYPSACRICLERGTP
jgi:hypothetical protein